LLLPLPPAKQKVPWLYAFVSACARRGERKRKKEKEKEKERWGREREEVLSWR
jgi:hypothetical protein